MGPGNHSAYCGTAYVVGVKIVRGDQGGFSRLAAMKLWELDVGCPEVGEEARELTQTVQY